MGVDADLGAANEKKADANGSEDLGEGEYQGDGYSDLSREFGERAEDDESTETEETDEDIRETEETLVQESDRPQDSTELDARGMIEEHEFADLGPQMIHGEPAEDLLGPAGPQPY